MRENFKMGIRRIPSYTLQYTTGYTSNCSYANNLNGFNFASFLEGNKEGSGWSGINKNECDIKF